MKKEEFIECLSERGLKLDEKAADLYDVYAAFLKEYNEKINLTAISEYEEVLEKHFYDSLLPALHSELKGKLADIGSGAGFPGVVMKIAYPELAVTLIEPLRKRCVFLNELKEKLGLNGLEVINERGEEHQRKEYYDFVTARAVSSLPVLLEVSAALVKVGGTFIAMRGSSGREEIEAADHAIKELGFRCDKIVEEELNDGSKRVIGYLKKERKTPIKYPRQYSIIKKRPL